MVRVFDKRIKIQNAILITLLFTSAIAFVVNEIVGLAIFPVFCLLGIKFMIFHSKIRGSCFNDLTCCIEFEDLNKLQSLLSDGADPNVKDGYGNTPLMAAVESGGDFNIKSISLLLAYGADPNLEKQEQKPIDIAKSRYERLSNNSNCSDEALKSYKYDEIIKILKKA